MTDVRRTEALLRRTAAVALDPAPRPLAAAAVARLRRERVRRKAIGVSSLAAALVAAVALGTSSALRSAIHGLFEAIPGLTAEEAVQLEPVPLDVAPPFLGEPASLEDAQRMIEFELQLPKDLGAPDAVFVRNDFESGAITAFWGPTQSPRAVLTEWKSRPVATRVTVTGPNARIERTVVSGSQGLWVEGTGRATYTVVGADGQLHKEDFVLAANVLFWNDGGTVFRLEVAADRDDAIALAESIARS